MRAARKYIQLPLFPNGVWHERAIGEPVTDSALRMKRMHELATCDKRVTAWLNAECWSVPVYQSDGETRQRVFFESYDGNAAKPKNTRLDIEEEEGRWLVRDILQPGRGIKTADPRTFGSDGHLVLLSKDGRQSTEFWQAWVDDMYAGGRAGDSISKAGSIAMFDVSGDSTGSQSGETELGSVRATGVSLLGGLLLPESFEEDEIPHALAMSAPGLRNLGPDHDPVSSGHAMPPNWYAPASTTESQNPSGSGISDAQALAAGERFRLAAKVVENEGQVLWEDGTGSSLPPCTQMVLRALRDYGAIPVDAAHGWCFYAEAPETADGVQYDNGDFVLHPEKIAWLLQAPDGSFLTWMDVIKKVRETLSKIPFGVELDGTWHANFEILPQAG